MRHWEYAANYDGKDNPITGNSQNGDVVAQTRVDARTTQSVYKKGGKVTVTQTSVVSADGKTRTVASKGTNAMGKAVDNVKLLRQTIGKAAECILHGMRTLMMTAVLVAASAGLLAESAAGIRWTAPAGWKVEGPRPMRAATYSISPVSGDQGIAECVVNYFGPGQGGTVEANIERWKGQVQGPDGKPAPATVERRTVRGVQIVLVGASGAYTGMGGPTVTSAKPVPGYRLLGAIVEGPDGNVFFKLTGPAKTIAEHEKNFDQLLASIQLDKQ